MTKKETISMVALVILVSVLDGRAGAKMIWGLVGEHFRKKKKQASGAHGYAAGYGTFQNTLHRLMGDGLVAHEARGVWKVTAAGKRAYVALIGRKEAERQTVRKRTEKVDMVIVFDVPEADRYKRARIRFELAALGFRMLQKSVWVGPGPVPEAFVRALRDMEMLSHVHIFSIARKGTISEAV